MLQEKKKKKERGKEGREFEIVTWSKRPRVAVSFQKRRQERATQAVKTEAKMSETTAFCENIVAGGGADVRRRRRRRRGGVRGEGRVEGGSVKKKRPRVLVLVRGWRREREGSGLGLGVKEVKSKWWIGMLKRRWSKTVEEGAEAEEPIGAMPML